jgi:hypothetical protein
MPDQRKLFFRKMSFKALTGYFPSIIANLYFHHTQSSERREIVYSIPGHAPFGMHGGDDWPEYQRHAPLQLVECRLS